MLYPTELGCPVANGLPACVAFCGGGWPGTRITHTQMLRALANGKLHVDKLGCGVLIEQVRSYQEDTYDERGRIQGESN